MSRVDADAIPDDLTPLDLDVLEAQLHTLAWLERDKVLVPPAIAQVLRTISHLRRHEPEANGWHGGERPARTTAVAAQDEPEEPALCVCGAPLGSTECQTRAHLHGPQEATQ